MKTIGWYVKVEKFTVLKFVFERQYFAEIKVYLIVYNYIIQYYFIEKYVYIIYTSR